jgi:hypothetical protein
MLNNKPPSQLMNVTATVENKDDATIEGIFPIKNHPTSKRKREVIDNIPNDLHRSEPLTQASKEKDGNGK